MAVPLAVSCPLLTFTGLPHLTTLSPCTVQGDGDAGFVHNHKLFAFSTAVFTSWDFHLTDWEAARNLRSSIQTQVCDTGHLCHDGAVTMPFNQILGRRRSFERVCYRSIRTHSLASCWL